MVVLLRLQQVITSIELSGFFSRGLTLKGTTYTLYLSRLIAYFLFCIFSFNVMENNVTRTLVSYRNVKLRSFKIKKMFQFSKLWQWFLQSDWQNKSNRNELLWFALSYLILFKYGGTVLSWDSMTVNFIPEPGINALIHLISIT